MTIHTGTARHPRLVDAESTGIPTASAFDKIVTPGGKDGKPKASTSREGYHESSARRAHPEPDHWTPSSQPIWLTGNEFEAQAVASYEFQQDCETQQIGFVTNFDGKVVCSRDRFIVQNHEGRIGMQVPPAGHARCLLAGFDGRTGKEDKVQLQGQMWVCEKEWVDILSYAPGMPQALFRVHRDDDFIAELAVHVLSFARELEEKSSEFAERGWIKPAAEEEEAADPFLTQADIDWAMNRSYDGQS